MSDDVASGKGARWRARLRVCLPLLLFLALAFVMAGVQLHRHLLQKTRLHGSVSFLIKGEQQPFEVELDGKPCNFGERVSLGYHTLSVQSPKAIRFQTNLFSWYGEHDLGKITLDRAMGTMAISAEPSAPRLTIQGVDFSVVLTNCVGFTSSVPTGDYVVEVIHKYWRQKESVSVAAAMSTARKFWPRLGALTISGSHPGIQFRLRDAERRLVESGTLPASLTDLPAGTRYQLDTERNGDAQDLAVTVTEKETNAIDVVFKYGSAVIDSVPAGATVVRKDRALGTTPLHLGEVLPGSFDFLLRLNEFEPVAGVMTIVANETNGFRTNLISQRYTQAMTAARRQLANSDYERAANTVAEALTHKPGDTAALALQHDIAYKSRIANAEGFAQRGSFTNAINEVSAALSISPGDTRANQLLADYSKQEQDRIESIRRREAERVEQQALRQKQERLAAQARTRVQELRQAFAAASQSYENASKFDVNEVSLSNRVSVAGADISSALSTKPPVFENVRLSWIRPHLFKIEARQRVGAGYRDCLILGTQRSDDEVWIQFKICEYEHPPEKKLLGGLLQVSIVVENTSQDPKVVAEQRRRFELRTKEGIELIRAKIQN